jgi:hypothetical protein
MQASRPRSLLRGCLFRVGVGCKVRARARSYRNGALRGGLVVCFARKRAPTGVSLSRRGRVQGSRASALLQEWRFAWGVGGVLRVQARSYGRRFSNLGRGGESFARKRAPTGMAFCGGWWRASRPARYSGGSTACRSDLGREPVLPVAAIPGRSNRSRGTAVTTHAPHRRGR